MIALLCAWHEHHERATRAVGRRLDDGGALAVAAPALIETYAVLTRLPPPHRLSPADSASLIAANFLNETVDAVGLDPSDYERLVRSAPRREIAGGVMYDAVILACAVAARVDVLLTFNQRQFECIAAGEIAIEVP